MLQTFCGGKKVIVVPSQVSLYLIGISADTSVSSTGIKKKNNKTKQLNNNKFSVAVLWLFQKRELPVPNITLVNCSASST